MAIFLLPTQRGKKLSYTAWITTTGVDFESPSRNDAMKRAIRYVFAKEILKDTTR